MAMRDEDPRTGALSAGIKPVGQDIRPVVARASAGLPWWIFISGMVLAGVLLFSVLDARRRAATMPPTKVRRADGLGVPPPIAPLFVPPAPPVAPLPPVVLTPIPMATPVPQPSTPQTVYVPQLLPTPPPPPPRPESPTGTTIDPVLVFDGGAGVAVAANNDGGNAAPAPDAAIPAVAASARASRTRQLPTLVAQGTLIPAVLESALDSTRPGPARALVTRDVRGFDGSRVLIPRGSRLFGDYRADVEPGQNRALVTWTRLVRPDGVAIALASPAGDSLGRVGIRGSVNTHFFERFASALLQSSLQIAVNRASQFGDSAVIVTNTGAVQNLTSPLNSGAQVRPTLRVRQGTTITVFVARDLDFTAVELRK
ncbi:MAG: TrbI/VirB10 family protein [Sphingomonas sp.]